MTWIPVHPSALERPRVLHKDSVDPDERVRRVRSVCRDPLVRVVHAVVPAIQLELLANPSSDRPLVVPARRLLTACLAAEPAGQNYPGLLFLEHSCSARSQPGREEGTCSLEQRS